MPWSFSPATGARPSPACLRAQLEIARIMALAQLLGRVAGRPVDDASALHRRPPVDLLRPALHMLIFVHGEEFVGALVAAAERQRSVPGPDGDVGDRILGAGHIFVLREPAVEHVQLPLGLHGIAVDGIFLLRRRVGEEMAEAAAKERRAAHLPEQP